MLPTITVIGNLKRIETKFTQNNKQVTKFQVECAEKNKNGEWTNLYLSGECWEKQAEFVNNYFNEGSIAIVTGKLYTNIYPKQDGSKVYENKLLFPKVDFAPKDKSEPQSQGVQHAQQHSQAQTGANAPIRRETVQSSDVPTIDIDEDEIPF